MCSSSQSCLRIRRGDEGNMKKQSGFRTFSNSAPRLWNALLHIVREYTFLTDTRKLLFSAKCWVAALTDNPTTLQMFSYFSVSRLGFGLFAVASLTTLLRCEHDSHMNTHALQAHRHHHHLPACVHDSLHTCKVGVLSWLNLPHLIRMIVSSMYARAHAMNEMNRFSCISEKWTQSKMKYYYYNLWNMFCAKWFCVMQCCLMLRPLSD